MASYDMPRQVSVEEYSGGSGRSRVFARFRAVTSPPDWEIEGLLENHDGRLVISDLTIRPSRYRTTAPEGGITSTLCQRIPVGTLLEAARRSLLVQPWARFQLLGESSTEEEQRWAVEAHQKASGGKGTQAGPSGYGDEFYERIARTYLELQEEGVSRGILHHIAERESEIQGREVDPTNVRDWVHKARKLDFLGPGTQGKAGRNPGPRLREKGEGE